MGWSGSSLLSSSCNFLWLFCILCYLQTAYTQMWVIHSQPKPNLHKSKQVSWSPLWGKGTFVLLLWDKPQSCSNLLLLYSRRKSERPRLGLWGPGKEGRSWPNGQIQTPSLPGLGHPWNRPPSTTPYPVSLPHFGPTFQNPSADWTRPVQRRLTGFSPCAAPCPAQCILCWCECALQHASAQDAVGIAPQVPLNPKRLMSE